MNEEGKIWPDLPLPTGTYNPLSEYEEKGNNIHIEFARLAKNPNPQAVLDFVNAWGLPDQLMKTVEEIIREAQEMHYYLSLYSLLNEDTQLVHERVRAHLEKMLDSTWWGNRVKEHLELFRSFNAADPDTALPDDELTRRALCGFVNNEIGEKLQWARPSLGFEFSNHRFTASFNSAGLLTSMYLMFWLDVMKGNPYWKCKNVNCGKVFSPQRANQEYCRGKFKYSTCANAERQRRHRRKGDAP